MFTSGYSFVHICRLQFENSNKFNVMLVKEYLHQSRANEKKKTFQYRHSFNALGKLRNFESDSTLYARDRRYLLSLIIGVDVQINRLSREWDWGVLSRMTIREDNEIQRTIKRESKNVLLESSVYRRIANLLSLTLFHAIRTFISSLYISSAPPPASLPSIVLRRIKFPESGNPIVWHIEPQNNIYIYTSIINANNKKRNLVPKRTRWLHQT